MRWPLALALVLLTGCWSQQEFLDRCVDAGHCDGGIPDYRTRTTWTEVSAELFAVDAGLDPGFTIESQPLGVSGTYEWFGGVLTSTGKVVCLPLKGDAALEIDPRTRAIALLPVPTHNGGWEGGVLLPDGTVLGLPFDTTSFLMLHPDGGTELIDVHGALGGVDSAYFEGGVLTLSGKVLLASYNASHLFVFDPATRQLTEVEGGSLSDSKPFFSGAILYADGESALLVPSQATALAVVTPTSTSFGTSSGGRGGGVLLPNGKAVMFPGEPHTFSVVSGTTVETPPGGTLYQGYFSAAWSTNGYAYGLQTDRATGKVAIVDMDGGVTEVDAGTNDVAVSSHWGLVGTEDGTIVACPSNPTHFAVFIVPNVKRTVSLRTMTSPWINKL